MPTVVGEDEEWSEKHRWGGLVHIRPFGEHILRLFYKGGMNLTGEETGIQRGLGSLLEIISEVECNTMCKGIAGVQVRI